MMTPEQARRWAEAMAKFLDRPESECNALTRATGIFTVRVEDIETALLAAAAECEQPADGSVKVQVIVGAAQSHPLGPLTVSCEPIDGQNNHDPKTWAQWNEYVGIVEAYLPPVRPIPVIQGSIVQ